MMSASSKSVIQDLIENPFSTRPFSEKCIIIEKGRPCPKLSNLKSVHKDSKKEYTRGFKESQYTRYPWLAGCENQVKLFCWPCLLFSRVNSAWNYTGMDNLNTLQVLQKKHKRSISHLQCVLKLATFGDNRVDDAISTDLRMLKSQQNMQVKRNREVLNRLIDLTCFLANQELSFGGHNEASSPNEGYYVELLNLLKRHDPTLCENFETATVFKGSLMAIQNDIIQAVGALLNSHVCTLLEQSEFVAIMLDELPDIQMQSQLSVVFRYCVQSKLHETLVGIIDVSSGRSAEHLSEHVIMILQKYDVEQKLVAQSYDGAAVITGHLEDLQTKVRDLCPTAIFVHSYAHILNVVLSQGLNNVGECKTFFSTLNGIATFASHSNKKNYSLKEYLKGKIPSLTSTKWCFSSRLVDIVHTHRDCVIEYFESIQKDDSMWDNKDRMAASGYSKFLKSFETVFLLNVFSKLFAPSDILFDTLQNQNIDIVFGLSQINEFYSFLRDQRDEGFSEAWQCTLQTVQAYDQKHRDHNDQSDSSETKYNKIFYEIIDNLIIQITERFSSLDKLKCFDLLNFYHFSEYTQKAKFPENQLDIVIKSFPDIFESSQLKNELAVFYGSSDDIRRHITPASTANKTTESNNEHNITPYDILRYLDYTNIGASFEQVYKLSKLICTLPATAVCVDRSYLKRIKTYLRNTEGQERQSFLTLLSIEKEMLAELRNSNDFYDRVIENFLAIKLRSDFMYK